MIEQPLRASLALQRNRDEIGFQRQWQELNEKFGYFDERPDLFPLFQELVQACRSMIVLVEQNNSPEDDMAYLYAYRLMALSIDVSNPVVPDLNKMAKFADELLKNIGSDLKHTPYHDVILNKIQLPDARQLKNLQGWRQFIDQNLTNNGVSVLEFFAMAPDIEKQIAKQPEAATRTTGFAPQSLAEAKTMADRCSYKRGRENPELASICREFNIPESGEECSFNICLDYLAQHSWPIKTTDRLPHPEITGEGETAAYRWVKLPTNDLRALVLGVITGCCQSIGGYSQQCVEDAVSLPENGLYVLLKLKPSKAQNSPVFLPDKSINYQAFEIVGQSYGWISENGNLTLDSFESSHNRVSDQTAHNILLQFANQVLQDTPTIERVTLGKGGGTPRAIGFERIYLPEKIRTGHEYGDAATQLCIAERQNARLSQDQRDRLNNILEPYKGEFKECVKYLEKFSDDPEEFLDDLKTLLEKDPAFSKNLHSLSLRRVLMLDPTPKLRELESLSIEEIQRLSPEEKRSLSVARLFFNIPDLNYFIHAIQCLDDEKKCRELILTNGLVKHNETPLYTSIQNPEHLAILLDKIPEDQRLEIVSKKSVDGQKDTILHAATRHPKSLLLIFNSLPKEQRILALADPKDEPNLLWSLCHQQKGVDFELILNIIKCLPQNSLPELLKTEDILTQNSLLLSKARKNPVWLAEVLNLYPDQWLSIVTDKNNKDSSIWDEVVNDFMGLNTILDKLEPEQRYKLFSIQSKSGENALQVAYRRSFSPVYGQKKTKLDVSEYLTKQELLELLKHKDESKQNTFDKAFSGYLDSEDYMGCLRTILSPFNEQECIAIFLESVHRSDWKFAEIDSSIVEQVRKKNPDYNPQSYGLELKQLLLEKINAIDLDPTLSVGESYSRTRYTLQDVLDNINKAKRASDLIKPIQNFQKLLDYQKSIQRYKSELSHVSKKDESNHSDDTKGQKL